LYRHWRNANNLHFPCFKLILRCAIFKRTCREDDAALRYVFEEYVLDTDRRELRRGDEVIPTAPQVLDLLNYLICNRGHVVSKDDLIGAVWNGRIVSDAALTTRMNAARSAIGDTGERQHLIRPYPGKASVSLRSCGRSRSLEQRTGIEIEPEPEPQHNVPR
jgi:DNA-binding response OmpR family regulator